MDDFREHDREQWSFGLLQIARELADIKIENEGEMSDYHAQIDALLKQSYRKVPGISDNEKKQEVLKQTRLYRSLRALETFSKPATCPEIAQFTERDLPVSNQEHVERISARHINWVLKDYPELVRRIKIKGDKIRYEILPPGRVYLKVVQSMKK